MKNIQIKLAQLAIIIVIGLPQLKAQIVNPIVD